MMLAILLCLFLKIDCVFFPLKKHYYNTFQSCKENEVPFYDETISVGLDGEGLCDTHVTCDLRGDVVISECAPDVCKDDSPSSLGKNEKCTCSTCQCLYDEVYYQNTCYENEDNPITKGSYYRFEFCAGHIPDTPFWGILCFTLIVVVFCVVSMGIQFIRCLKKIGNPYDLKDIFFGFFRAIVCIVPAVKHYFLKVFFPIIIKMRKSENQPLVYSVLLLKPYWLIPVGGGIVLCVVGFVFVFVGIISVALSNFAQWPWLVTIILWCVGIITFLTGLLFLFFLFCNIFFCDACDNCSDRKDYFDPFKNRKIRNVSNVQMKNLTFQQQ